MHVWFSGRQRAGLAQGRRTQTERNEVQQADMNMTLYITSRLLAEDTELNSLQA